MAAPRLLFLYPIFYKPLSVPKVKGRPSQDAIDCGRCQRSQRRQFTTTLERRLEPFPERHGTAIEPLLGSRGDDVRLSRDDGKGPITKKADIAKKVIGGNQDSQTRETLKNDPTNSVLNLNKDPTRSGTASEQKTEQVKGSTSTIKSSTSNPPETVLHVDPPSSTARHEKPPHLQAPPYVHHFDTYTIVRDLEKKGFTQEHSVTLMKAVRGLLTTNLEMAQEGLVSKSDVENETYLFRAACSELRTEIQKKRQAETERMRTERAQLQYEVDILNQKLTQELLNLKDALKGMFDDRKMAVRMEQRARESSIQELNYKITVSLNSDVKSEVEGLRWVLTRRAAIAIASMAFLILSSLRYSSYRIHLQEVEQQKLNQKRNPSSVAPSTSSTSSSNEDDQVGSSDEVVSKAGGAQQPQLANLPEGSNPGYVSLG